MPCETMTNVLSAITKIVSNSFSLSVECDSRTRVSYASHILVTTITTVETSCPHVFFSVKQNSTLKARFFPNVTRIPKDPWPECSIPESECQTAWNLFSQHFEGKRSNLTKNWEFLHPGASNTVPQDGTAVNMTAAGVSFDIERFLRWFNYVPNSGFLNGCPDAQVPFIQNCFHKPDYYRGNNYDDILSSLSWPHDENFHSLNSSQKLEEFGKLLACDIWIDSFMLILPPIPEPYTRSRDLCANDCWGDFTNFTVANQTSYSIDNITFTKFSVLYGKFIL